MLTHHLKIMQLNNDEFINYDILKLKKQYHKLAKTIHPDKGGSDIEFQQLNNSYNILNELLVSKINNDDINSNNVNDYIEIFRSMVKDNNITDYLYKKCMIVMKKIMIKYKYDIQNILFPDKNNIYIELNPSLSDIMINNICKYNYKDVYFLVPLWHSEIHFEYKNENIIFICNPELPNNYIIDKVNNIHIFIKKQLSDIFKLDTIDILFNNNTLRIPVNKLYIKKNQQYIFENQGVSGINISDIYNIQRKMDIIIHIELE
jgi:hypothetical protein